VLQNRSARRINIYSNKLFSNVDVADCFFLFKLAAARCREASEQFWEIRTLT
jgi:hypothetical protein